MKQTILHIAEAFGGGIVTFIANLANEQCEKYNVVIAHGIRPETHQNYKDFFAPCIRLIKVNSFRQHISLANEWKSVKELHRLISDIQPDIIHMHSSQSGVLGKLASWDYKASKVYSPHGFSFLKQDVAGWKQGVFKGIEKAFSLFDCTLVASCPTEFEVAKTITSHARLVMNGINTSTLDKYLDIEFQNKKTVVGMVGRALPQKNPSLFNRIAELMPAVDFEWIGDGELRGLLTAPNIHIVGWGPREEALEYLSKCDIYIMTSLWEGMPLALLEAMYLKKPCVVTDVVGNRDVIQNDVNGFVCKDESDFVDKIAHLITNRDERERMGVRAHKDVVEKYNSRVMAENYDRVYLMKKEKIS